MSGAAGSSAAISPVTDSNAGYTSHGALLQHQDAILRQQDAALTDLSKSIGTLRNMGGQIHNELSLQATPSLCALAATTSHLIEADGCGYLMCTSAMGLKRNAASTCPAIVSSHIMHSIA
eukprot:scaffold69120_cov35-Tisochrysis_lutea.AAC.1